MTAPTSSARPALVRRTWQSAFVPQNWAPEPSPPLSPIAYVGPGIAEIKPHVGESIRDGLEQLREELARIPMPSHLSLYMKNKIKQDPLFKGKDVVLLTYLFKHLEKMPNNPPAIKQLTTRQLQLPLTRKLTVFALRPHAKFMEPPTAEEKREVAALRDKLKTLKPEGRKRYLEGLKAKGKNTRTSSKPKTDSYPEGKSKAEKERWLKGLGTWYVVNAADLPSHSYDYWLTSLGPAGRGTAFEPAVRQAFIETINPLEHHTWVKAPITEGPDVVWREVAEYLYELAGELAEDR